MSDEDLLLPKLAAGDAAAARACVERFGGLVWSLARRYTSSAADAEDAAQEIFLDLHRSADRFEPERSSEIAFVAMIARRRLIDLRRRQARREHGVSLEARAPSNPVAEQSAEASLVKRALARLSATEREVLVLATLEGLTQQEIAERTGLPLGTVKTTARRGLLRVREMLGAGALAEASEEVEP